MSNEWKGGIVALTLLVVGVGGFFIYQHYFAGGEAPQDGGEVAGTVDDGSSVQSGTAVTVEAKINDVASAAGVQITPLEVVEDSRCPADVQCIQAGTVRVRASVIPRGSAQAEDVMFELGVPMTVGTDQVTLVAAAPEAREGIRIAPGDYTFTFTVVKEGGGEYFKG
jgi:hypothetical protein